MQKQNEASRRTPKCVLSARNRQSMEGVVESPTLADLVIDPVEALLRVIGRNILPVVCHAGELAHDSLARAGSALVDLDRRN